MAQELYTELREYALREMPEPDRSLVGGLVHTIQRLVPGGNEPSNGRPKLDQSLVGKYVMVYEQVDFTDGLKPVSERSEAHTVSDRESDREDYSESGTIYVGRVSDAREISRSHVRRMGGMNLRASIFGRPAPYNSYTSPRVGIKFENDRALAITPEHTSLVHGYSHESTWLNELTSPRILDDDGLVSKVESLMEELDSPSPFLQGTRTA